MSHTLVDVRELLGWGFDSYEYRPDLSGSEISWKAADLIARRAPLEQSNTILTIDSKELRESFEVLKRRSDLLSEMSGLAWSLGVVDLRTLIAFQRRIVLGADTVRPSVPVAGDWPTLLEMSFGLPKPVSYETFHDRSTRTVTLRSGNPNLHIRIGTEATHPLTVHGGGPFFEVASLRGHWFLRDGYHRAFAFLQAGVFAVPAVVVEARSIEELGANEPWFFPEEVLFSDAPPRVMDFLNEDLNLKYQRPPFIKTVQIKIEETLKPTLTTGEQS